MAPQLLTIEVTRPATGRARLRLTGDLDYDSAPELIERTVELRRDGAHDLEIDLSGVGLCDSSGLSAFVVVHRGGTGPVRLTGVGAHLQQLLDRTGLVELLTVERGRGLREAG